MTRHAVVIGAGISGLATANDLIGRGWDVTVLERQTVTGGNAVSERFGGGFLMEHGPSTLNAAFPAAMDQIRDLGLADSSVDLGPGVQKRYLSRHGKMHGISVGRLGFLLSDYLSLRGRLSLVAEPFRRRRHDGAEETIHGFVSRRFGTEFADKIIDPMAAGIFMGDSRELSVAGAFPKLVEMEQKYGSILRAVVSARPGSEPGRRLFSWRDGIATLPRTLAGRLGDRVRTGVTVTEISRPSGGFAIETARHGRIMTDAVVLAVQPHVAAGLLAGLDPESVDALSEIPAPPVAVVFLGYKRRQVAHPLDGLGCLSTRDGNPVVSGVQFPSTMFPARAPNGHVAIAAYVGGARNPGLSGLPADDLSALVQGELAGLLQIRGEPVVNRVRHWPMGLPHYTIGHVRRRQVIETAHQRTPGLYLTGNYLSGVSVTGCLEQAQTTAAALDAAAGEKPMADTAASG